MDCAMWQRIELSKLCMRTYDRMRSVKPGRASPSGLEWSAVLFRPAPSQMAGLRCTDKVRNANVLMS